MSINWLHRKITQNMKKSHTFLTHRTALTVLAASLLAGITLNATLTLRTDSQAEGALGWGLLNSYQPGMEFDLSPFDDWIVANNSGSVPGVLVRRAGGNVLSLAEIRTAPTVVPTG